jgi:hypothetical protein
VEERSDVAKETGAGGGEVDVVLIEQEVSDLVLSSKNEEGDVISTHASVLVDSVGPPSAEVCRAAASFP